MSPVRREGDFQRRPIKDWDSYIEDAIIEAQARGEFDNLPDAGKPIRIETNPLAPELDIALSRLRNAGYKPTWMELDEEIKVGQDTLARFVEDSIAYVSTQTERIRSGVVSPAVPSKPPASFWKQLMQGSSQPVSSSVGPETIDDLLEFVDRMRNQYLEKSAQLDKRIGEFNGSLARNLWHLERMRLTPERASRKFDSAFASIDLNH